MVGTSNERRIRGCKGQARAIDQVAMRADLKAQHPLRDGGTGFVMDLQMKKATKIWDLWIGL